MSKWRKRAWWLFRYMRWRLGLRPEQPCTCLDPWTCGRPHAAFVCPHNWVTLDMPKGKELCLWCHSRKEAQ